MFKETALSFSIQLVNYPQQLAHWGSGAKASLAEADNPEAEVQALEGQSPKGSAGRCVTALTPGKPLLSSFCQKPLFACPAVSGVQEGKQSQLEPDYSPPGFRWCEWEAVVPRQLPDITLSPGGPVCPRLGFRNDCIFFKFTLNENDFNQRWKKSMKFWL